MKGFMAMGCKGIYNYSAAEEGQRSCNEPCSLVGPQTGELEAKRLLWILIQH